MKLTSLEYANLVAAKPHLLDRSGSGPVVECGAGHAPLETIQAQAGHTGKFLVRVTSFRRRLLDEDNLCEKFHVDCLRYAGLLRADSPDAASIEVRQIKVRTKAEERTEIVIARL